MRQFQPWALKSSQVWLVPCALETGGATAAVLAGLAVGATGLAGVWLHAPVSTHTATATAKRVCATTNVSKLNSVILRMVSLLWVPTGPRKHRDPI